MTEQSPEQPQSSPTKQPAKTNTKLIVGIVIAAVVLIGGSFALAMTLSNKDKDQAKTTPSAEHDKKHDEKKSADDKIRTANSKTAASFTDFKSVCEKGSISNAAAPAKPYKVAAFYKEDNGRDRWSIQTLKYNAPYTVDTKEYEQINAVVCLSEKSGDRVKTQTCEFDSKGEKLAIDYYATAYNAVAHEAKTGKKIKDLGKISAPATTCPTFVSYDKKDPKIVARPDSAAVDAAIAAFAN